MNVKVPPINNDTAIKIDNLFIPVPPISFRIKMEMTKLSSIALSKTDVNTDYSYT